MHQHSQVEQFFCCCSQLLVDQVTCRLHLDRTILELGSDADAQVFRRCLVWRWMVDCHSPNKAKVYKGLEAQFGENQVEVVPSSSA